MKNNLLSHPCNGVSIKIIKQKLPGIVVFDGIKNGNDSNRTESMVLCFTESQIIRLWLLKNIFFHHREHRGHGAKKKFWSKALMRDTRNPG